MPHSMENKDVLSFHILSFARLSHKMGTVDHGHACGNHRWNQFVVFLRIDQERRESEAVSSLYLEVFNQLLQGQISDHFEAIP